MGEFASREEADRKSQGLVHKPLFGPVTRTCGNLDSAQLFAK